MEKFFKIFKEMERNFDGEKDFEAIYEVFQSEFRVTFLSI